MEAETKHIICDAFQDIETELITKALTYYFRRDYADFWRALESTTTLLTVKEKLKCEK